MSGEFKAMNSDFQQLQKKLKDSNVMDEEQEDYGVQYKNYM